MTQPSLFSQRAPAAEDAARLLAVLRGRGWVSRADLQWRFFGAEWPERRFRAAAEASKGQILGGQKGYCVAREASVDDVHHVANALRSQARKMIRRSIEVRRALLSAEGAHRE